MILPDVLGKIASDLDWRGPSGKPLGHICLTREEALLLMAWIEAGTPNAQDAWRSSYSRYPDDNFDRYGQPRNKHKP